MGRIHPQLKHFNNTLQIYTMYHLELLLSVCVTAHRCAGGRKKLDLRSGSHSHRHFVAFFEAVYGFICGRRRVAFDRYRMSCLVLFNVPSQALTRGNPF